VHQAWSVSALLSATGWRRCRGCLMLLVSFRKRATNCRSLLWKESYTDKASALLSVNTNSRNTSTPYKETHCNTHCDTHCDTHYDTHGDTHYNTRCSTCALQIALFSTVARLSLFLSFTCRSVCRSVCFFLSPTLHRAYTTHVIASM